MTDAASPSAGLGPDHGYGPDIDHVLLSEAQIQSKIAELATVVARDYAGKEVLLVGVLKGAVLFMSDFARALQVCLRKLDALWQRPMPYILAIHQAPAHGVHPHAHVHVEIYPWLRMPARLKYLAGSEIGAGVFTADTLPEDKARELREVQV